MQIADGIHMLTLSGQVGGRSMDIHPVLFVDGDAVVLADTGMPGHLPAIRGEMEKAGIPFERLTAVLLTHQDIDHIGSAPDIAAAIGHPVEIIAHEADRPYIEGDKPLLKMNPERMKRMLDNLPADQRERMEAMLANPPRVKVTRTVAAGDRLPWCGGAAVLHTPGHTPGHISLYLPESRTLIAGDAMVGADGQIQGPNPQATPDMEGALHSLRQLASYDIEQVVCYHGGRFRDGVAGQLARFA